MDDQQTKQQPVKPGTSKFVVIAAAVFVMLSVGFLGGWLGAAARSQGVGESTEQARRVVTEQSELISAIAKEVGPSVVSVNVTSKVRTNDFFGPQSVQQQSAGTGFIISADGYVVTNRHVIPSGTTEVTLVLDDGTVLDKVSVVGKTNASDPLDVAFLKIQDAKGKKLQPVKIGDSAKMKVGDMAIAIGNALGQFQNTVTSGIISGYGRSVTASDGGQNTEDLQNLFQTDAAINQGNSGGPLVNANGEVIGINTAVAGGDAENIGFAIPTNDVKGLIQSVLKEGKLLRPYLGVRYIMLNEGYAEQLDVKQTEGAYILPSERSGDNSILSDSPAKKAGLKEGDVIVKVNGNELGQNNTLVSEIGRYPVGETVELTIIRDGKEQTVKVTLEAAPKS